MIRIIAETSVAKVYYSWAPEVPAPGSFYVHDKLRDEAYWESHCYDGGEGWSNKDKQEEHEKAITKFVEFNIKLDRVLTEDDRDILKDITEPVLEPVKNSKYWKH